MLDRWHLWFAIIVGGLAWILLSTVSLTKWKDADATFFKGYRLLLMPQVSSQPGGGASSNTDLTVSGTNVPAISNALSAGANPVPVSKDTNTAKLPPKPQPEPAIEKHPRLELKAFAALLLLAFCAGTVRLLFDTESDPRRLRRVSSGILSSFVAIGEEPAGPIPLRIGEITQKDRSDAWAWYFGVTVVLSAVGAVWDWWSLSWMVEPWRVVCWNLIAFAGYLSWVYVAIFNRLTRKHDFSEVAARAFIGQWTRSTTPRQAVIIGPRKAGKTCFIKSKIDPKEDTTRTPGIYLRSISGVNLSVVDTPGENLGDHLILTARYRADTLVLIMDAAELKEALPTDVGTPEDCVLLFQEHTDPEKCRSRTYIERFVAATACNADSIPPGEIYQVRTFILFANIGKHSDIPLQKQSESLKSHRALLSAARALGARLGVAPADCSAVVAPAPNAGVAINLLTMPDSTRRMKEAGMEFANM